MDISFAIILGVYVIGFVLLGGYAIIKKSRIVKRIHHMKSGGRYTSWEKENKALVRLDNVNRYIAVVALFAFIIMAMTIPSLASYAMILFLASAVLSLFLLTMLDEATKKEE